MLEAARAGDHALLVAATGAGKTLAGFLPVLAELTVPPKSSPERGGGPLAPASGGVGSRSSGTGKVEAEKLTLADSPLRHALAGAPPPLAGEETGLHTLYISPLKALAVDVRRNLLGPIEEMGLDIRVETRTGDTPSDRKARQRVRPPQILLTTPESLSLLLAHEDSVHLFANLKTVIVDEIHAFATQKRGDLLSLCLARLQSISPAMRRVGLTATIADPDAYRAWLAPWGDIDSVRLVAGEPGAEPDIQILVPEGRVPWSGHSGRYAAGHVMEIIAAHQTTLIFCNTRSLAELIFQDLWKANNDQLPIGIHHGSLSVEARRRVEEAMAAGKLRALVATASLDLGVDWGNVDCVVQMGAPKGASRLVQRIGRANHRLDEPSKAIVVPGNRFEYLEARAALDAIADGELDQEVFRHGAMDVLAQHIMACACAAPFEEGALLAEIQSATPYSALDQAQFERVLHFVANGGYALKAYDKYSRIVRQADGIWRVAHPQFIRQHRMNAGIIVDAPMISLRFKNGRHLGQVEEYFASTLMPGDAFYFAGMAVEVERMKEHDLIVRASTRPARIISYTGLRLALSTNLAGRVRTLMHDRNQWYRFPDDVREWLEIQAMRSAIPAPDDLLIETFPHEGKHYMAVYSFEGWNAHQAMGMLVTRRMEDAGLKPLGFVANDYAFLTYGLEPIANPAALLSPDILDHEFVEWVEGSHMLKRAFREVAIIGGLVERQHPGQKKSGRQVTFSTDLIYDVLRKYEPDHLLLEAAWADARTRMADVARLGDLLDRAAETMVHKVLERVSPLAVPLMVIVGHENVARQATEDELLAMAEALADEAMG